MSIEEIFDGRERFESDGPWEEVVVHPFELPTSVSLVEGVFQEEVAQIISQLRRVGVEAVRPSEDALTLELRQSNQAGGLRPDSVEGVLRFGREQFILAA